jgi:hypothetical protein
MVLVRSLSLGRYAELSIGLVLLFSEHAEETDFLLTRWLPLVI